MRRRRRRAALWALGGSLALVCALWTSSASAAVTVGSNLAVDSDTGICTSSPDFQCTAANLALPPSSQAPGGTVASVDGVITRWRLKFGTPAPIASARVRLRVVRGQTAAGAGPLEDPAASSGTQEFA